MTSILFGIGKICHPQSKWNYFKNENHFFQFSFAFRNLHQILGIFKKKLIVIANLFPKLQTVKDLAKPLCKKPRFRTPFDSQDVEGYKTLVKLAECTSVIFFHHSFTHFEKKDDRHS